MADTHPTKVSLWRAIRLCLLGIFAPTKLAEEEKADNAARQNYSGKIETLSSAFVVRRAFWVSLALVAGSIAVGYIAGRLTTALFGVPPHGAITASQILGASALLWGTLFVRGWEIQSFAGVTLSERVNQWTYRFLYCTGTAVIVWSLASTGFRREAPEMPEGGDGLGMFEFTLTHFLFPTIVGVTAYLLTDRFGEWRKRRMCSRLGVIIVESLQEEIQTGIKVMSDTLAAMQDGARSKPPREQPPIKSWSGMTTIPDEVLLRIIETSAGGKFAGFNPNSIRSHTKNYFDHMCENYNGALAQAISLAQSGQDWRAPFREFLFQGNKSYIESAKHVAEMLENVKTLLDSNATAWFPK